MNQAAIKRDPSKVLQIGFLTLLFVCILQVGWWITDNLNYTSEVRREIAALDAVDSVAADALANLELESAGRINRYIWEGGFFLLVLVAGMAVLTRTIRHDAELRRRQQNFLAAVSHEFKSPLASMQLAAETLVMRSEEEDSRRLGQRVLGDCERLLRMVDNLLDTNRLEEGRHELTFDNLALNSLVQKEIGNVINRASEHGIEISEDLDPDIRIRADRDAVETILRNLLDNSIKACAAADGGKVVVSVKQTEQTVALTVRDDGIGFAPENAGLMFEKFFRLGDEQTRATPGTGLGLYIVKRLAAMSGASVTAASDGPGRGAAVTVRWPQSAGTQAAGS